jgi:hypothetical protein
VAALGNGDVLVSGLGETVAATVERYHATDGTWTTETPPLPLGLQNHALSLSDGSVMVLGGRSATHAQRFVVPATTLELATTLLSGCIATSGKITLTGPAPAGGLTVPLSSDNPNVVVPTSLFIKSGATRKSFSILTSAVAARETATIEASVSGEMLAATLSIEPMGVKTVLLSPDPVVGGATVSGIVALRCAAGPGDITVALSSTKPDIAAPTTATVTIPVGTNFLPFEVMTTPVTAETKASIKATANGVTKSNALVVRPGS